MVRREKTGAAGWGGAMQGFSIRLVFGRLVIGKKSDGNIASEK